MAANTEYTKIKESAISAFFTKLKDFFWKSADVVTYPLADVATTGSYNDLRDTPTIPTIPSIDSTPTSGSTNLVTSGGVYAVLGDVESLINAL